MQNRYTGDIGDFGKYGLLRELCGPPQKLRLGVVWYLFPDESHNSDGKHTGYLDGSPGNRARFRNCDAPLYDTLRRLVQDGKGRRVAGIRESGLLPDGTVYHEPELSYPPGASRHSRQATRRDWLSAALEATAGADVVFLDPDNGISETADPLGKNGPKFVFMEELREFAGRDRSMVIYHHQGRRGTAVQQINHLAGQLQSELDLPRRPWALWYHRGTARVYFIVPRKRHEPILEDRLARFLNGPWRDHFEPVK